MDLERIKDVRELPGKGIPAFIGGRKIVIRNENMMRSVGASPLQADNVGTAVYVAEVEKYLGSIIIADQPKEGAADALRALRSVGVSRTVMLTGYLREVAEVIGHTLGLDEIVSELLPYHNVKRIEAILQNRSFDGTVASVGDGINDASVLTRADVGIAMGTFPEDPKVHHGNRMTEYNLCHRH